ncbi:DNA helicase RecQ [bacterium]|nr:DNA helicase RecQ [bacterium]
MTLQNQYHIALKKHFGFNSFKADQETIIYSIMNNEDVVSVLPTGSGKSLCYQLPAVLKKGTTIVLSPLISLMQDQVMQLSKQGISAAFINSSNDMMDNEYIMQHMHEYKLIYISPERLTTPGFIDRLKQSNLSGFVIDEAHCISQWGHAFRPEYRSLSLIKEQFPTIPISAFTATATPDVEKDISTQLNMTNPVHIKASFDRENLTLKVYEKDNYRFQLETCLQSHKGASGIIYASTRKKVDRLFDDLNSKGFNVAKYHAGLSDQERQRTLENFIYEKTDIVVATVAFGMGINKPNVRFVFHIDMPQNIEQYYQEIGRAGRDGLESECTMLYSLQDVVMQKKFADDVLEGSIRNQMKRKSDQMLALCNSTECRRKEILKYFGENFKRTPCNHCDTCLEPAENMDGTIIAQKILSCVYKLQQRFGIGYVSDILKGAKIKLILNRNHDRLSTYGLLSDFSKSELRHFIFSLINQGYLIVSDGDYPLLKLTQKSRDILFNNKQIFFKKRIVKAKPESSKKSNTKPPSFVSDDNYKLYMELKSLRLALANKQNVPPYVIFHDKTLMEMAKAHPKTDSSFLELNGVGPQKLAKYGKDFLSKITEMTNTH